MWQKEVLCSAGQSPQLLSSDWPWRHTGKSSSAGSTVRSAPQEPGLLLSPYESPVLERWWRRTWTPPPQGNLSNAGLNACTPICPHLKIRSGAALCKTPWSPGLQISQLGGLPPLFLSLQGLALWSYGLFQKARKGRTKKKYAHFASFSEKPLGKEVETNGRAVAFIHLCYCRFH